MVECSLYNLSETLSLVALSVSLRLPPLPKGEALMVGSPWVESAYYWAITR